MIAKVVLGNNAECKKKLVSIVEAIPYDAGIMRWTLCGKCKIYAWCFEYADFETGELHVHTDNAKECEEILFKLLEAGLLMDTNDAVCRSIYDIATLGRF